MIRYFRSWFAVLRGILIQYAEADYNRNHDPLAIARAKTFNRWFRWWLIPSGVFFILAIASVMFLPLAGQGLLALILVVEGLVLMLTALLWYVGFMVASSFAVKRVKKAYRIDALHHVVEDAREDRIYLARSSDE